MFEGQSRTESSSSFHERPMSLSFLKVKTKSSQNKGNLFCLMVGVGCTSTSSGSLYPRAVHLW